MLDFHVFLVVLRVLMGLTTFNMTLAELQPYDFPTLPTREAITQAVGQLGDTTFTAALQLSANSATTGIPKMFWVTMKHVHKLQHIAQVSERHPKWVLNVIDDDHMNRFFETIYANTSVLWAFRMINPSLGAAKADLFRYAVLYSFGGVYFDADTTFTGQLDHYLTPKDKFVWASEGNPMGDCYQPSHPLSRTPSMNKDRSILQWMLLSIPSHPFTARALTNAVDVIRRLYLKQNILSKAASPPEGKPYMQLMCATGPVLFSVTVRQICAEYSGNDTSILGHRYAGKDFEEIGGHFKAPGFKEDSEHHYSTHMNKHGAQLLKSYAS